MKNILAIFVLSVLTLSVFAQKPQVKFQIETSHGIMKGVLYNETPQHRDNFIKLVNEGWYEDSPFHRIIKDFMIQGGGNKDGRQDPGYKVPAEFLPNKYVHKKGALAAARQGDNVNPTKASSGSQFYIAQGKVVTDSQLAQVEQRANKSEQNRMISEYITRPENASLYAKVDSLQRSRNMDALNSLAQEILKIAENEEGASKLFHYSEKQKEVYRTIGGTPHLDGGYTVFGEITEGLDVIDKIATVPVNGSNPAEKLSMKISILED